MQSSANEDSPTNPPASEKLPLDGGSSNTALNEVCVTRYVSDVNCRCPPLSDAVSEDKDASDVYDLKLVADPALVDSTDELTDGSGCMSLTEPSSSQVGSIVTVISQNHVTGDCVGNECLMAAAGGLKDSVPNSCRKDKSADGGVIESVGKPESQSRCDGAAGMYFMVSFL